VATLALAGPAAHAQEANEQPPLLTAADFLGRVEKSNPRIEALAGEVAVEAASVTAAGLWANPSLAYGREDVYTGGRSFPENVLRLDLPLEISGRRGLKVEGAELGVRAASQTAQRNEQGILLDALGVYLRAASARLKVAALLQERAALGRLVEAVKSRTAAGDASGYDLDRLAIEADGLEDLIEEAERERMAFGRALGVLTGAPESRLDAGDPLGLPTVLGNAGGGDLLAGRPDYKAAGLRVAQTEKEAAAAGRGWIPSLTLSGGAKSAVLERDTWWGYVAGLALSLPFLDYGQADAERARARLRVARAEQKVVEQLVLVQVRTNSENLARTVKQAQRFETSQVPRLERLVKRAEVAFQEGERPVFELLDAYRTARGIRLRAVELRLQARLAEVELWRSRGFGPGGNP
jgi:cobalt-zinc-cadmium efflux system outer membrane protein